MLAASYFPVVVMIIIYGGLLVALIYLIFKRIADKKKENFEKRDN